MLRSHREGRKGWGPEPKNRRITVVRKIGISFFPIEENKDTVDVNKCRSTDYNIFFLWPCRMREFCRVKHPGKFEFQINNK